jgi:hypothetical protein
MGILLPVGPHEASLLGERIAGLSPESIVDPGLGEHGEPAAPFPNDLRHTGASLTIAAGCHVKVIAEQTGHSDGGALVLKRYGHLYKGKQKVKPDIERECAFLVQSDAVGLHPITEDSGHELVMRSPAWAGRRTPAAFAESAQVFAGEDTRSIGEAVA